MLVLSRFQNQSIHIGNDIVITVVDVRGDRVRIGIDAPQNIPVNRQEVYDRILAQSDQKRVVPIVVPTFPEIGMPIADFLPH
ncbi:MAG: carbon storage regulator CsrA [Thermoguttaceae bacterium]